MNFRPLSTFSDPGGELVPHGNGGNGWSSGNDGGGGGGDPLLGGGGPRYGEINLLIELLRNCLQGYGEGVVQYALGTKVQTKPASTLPTQVASSICGQFAPSNDRKPAQSSAAQGAGRGGVELSFVPIEQRAHYQARILQLFDRMMTDEQFARFVREQYTKLAHRGTHRIPEE